MYKQLFALLTKLNNRQAKFDIHSILKLAATTSYYRAIPVRSPKSGSTWDEKVEDTKQQALAIISKIFTEHSIEALGYNTTEHNISRHWEVAVYYSHYQTERQRTKGNPILPIIVSGTVSEELLGPDKDELLDPSLKWPSLQDIENRNYSSWFDFMSKNFGAPLVIDMLKQYVNDLQSGIDPQKAKDNAVNTYLTQDRLHDQKMSVDTNFKDQLRLPVSVMKHLPVENVFIITNENGKDNPIEVTPDNYQQIIASWKPYNPDELKQIKQDQPFEGVQERYYPFATR